MIQGLKISNVYWFSHVDFGNNSSAKSLRYIPFTNNTFNSIRRFDAAASVLRTAICFAVNDLTAIAHPLVNTFTSISMPKSHHEKRQLFYVLPTTPSMLKFTDLGNSRHNSFLGAFSSRFSPSDSFTCFNYSFAVRNVWHFKITEWLIVILGNATMPYMKVAVVWINAKQHAINEFIRTIFRYWFPMVRLPASWLLPLLYPERHQL